MANLTGEVQIFSADTDIIDSTAKHNVGIRAYDSAGNEYIYLLGIGSTVAGDWVSFDEAGATTLLITNARGRVGIAMAAIVADKYGWYQIYGKNTIALGTSGHIATDSCLYTSAAAGVADDVDASTEFIVGAFSRSADASGVFTAELKYPMVLNAAID